MNDELTNLTELFLQLSNLNQEQWDSMDTSERIEHVAKVDSLLLKTLVMSVRNGATDIDKALATAWQTGVSTGKLIGSPEFGNPKTNDE